MLEFIFLIITVFCTKMFHLPIFQNVKELYQSHKHATLHLSQSTFFKGIVEVYLMVFISLNFVPLSSISP